LDITNLTLRTGPGVEVRLGVANAAEMIGVDVDVVGRGGIWLSLGAKTLANDGDETAGRGIAVGGVCGLCRFIDNSAAIISEGVVSMNLRFLDNEGVGTVCPPSREPCSGGAAGAIEVVPHLDQGGGGGTCGLVTPICRSVIKPFTGGE